MAHRPPWPGRWRLVAGVRVAGGPERLQSLALMEPAWAGRAGQTPEEAAVYDRFRAIARLPADETMAAFVRAQLADGVEPPTPPPGPLPPWMASRSAGIGVVIAAFDRYQPDLAVFRGFRRPVYYALGGLSNPDLYARIAAHLGHLFPDFRLETYPNRYHFDPPHRIEPAKVATTLRALLSRVLESTAP